MGPPFGKLIDDVVDGYFGAPWAPTRPRTSTLRNLNTPSVQ
jgi:hypothetical protein